MRKKSIAALPVFLWGLLLAVLCLGAAQSAYAAKKLAAPELLWVDWASGTQLSIRWNQVKKADGYVISRSKTADGEYQVVATNKGKTNLRAIVKSKKNDIYFYKVQAYQWKKGKRVLGKDSNVIANVKYRKSHLGELFPGGPPKTESAMQKYLVDVRLKIRNTSGKKAYITLPIHKKLKTRVKAVFNDLYKLKFRTRSRDTGSYNWRRMRTVNLMSHHSYGCVVDLNWDSNPMVTLAEVGKSEYRPGKDRYSVTEEVVAVWKSYGFYWGGDWPEKKDYMHFTYTNN